MNILLSLLQLSIIAHIQATGPHIIVNDKMKLSQNFHESYLYVYNQVPIPKSTDKIIAVFLVFCDLLYYLETGA